MAARDQPSSGAPAAHSRVRGESGQAAVEFALVVLILCVIVLAIVDFAKAMNYWLDLNHVASDTARKAAVNTFATAAEYQTYASDRLETQELKAGGTGSVPAAASISICLPEGGDVGDPVTVRVAVGYHWIPFIGGPDLGITGTATMRIEQKADYSAVGTCT
jgi:hypothetical protein